MDSEVRASYRLSPPGVTTPALPSSTAGTRGAEPVQSPVLTVAAGDLPSRLLDRLDGSDSTG